VNVLVIMHIVIRITAKCLRTCTLSLSSCTEVDCSRPKLLDGTVCYDGTGYNMSVEYKCDEGFSLIGSSTRVCRSDGMWSGEEPVCEGKHACCRLYL